MHSPGHLLLRLGLLVWVLGTCIGFAILWHFSSTPGIAARPPISWPADTALGPDPGRETLLLFLHPRCPCSRATVAEFCRLLPQLTPPVNTYVLFFHPPGVDGAWEQTSIAAAVQAMPGVRVVTDFKGEEAHRFGARTSGQVMLYDALGGLQFSGGITSARGHEGDSDGQRSVKEILAGAKAACVETPVYGCPLFASTADS